MHMQLTARWVDVTTRWHEHRRRNERGLTTTEVAVLTFVLVAIAVAIGALLYNYANETVSDAPRPDIPDFSE
ncbi:MAG: hypothetical protein AAF567_13300 [Actinomycetota bacterium]